MQTSIQPSSPPLPSNLHSDPVQVGSDDRADDEDTDLEGSKDEAKVPHLKPLADRLSREEGSLNYKKMWASHTPHLTLLF